MLRTLRGIAAVAFIFAGVSPAFSQVIYVDNLRGDDAANGAHATPLDLANGPVRTIARGLQLLKSTGTLNLANHGTPYFASMELMGNASGTPLQATVIEGNGAELNGAFLVPHSAWRKESRATWKFTPLRKGHFLLLSENKPFPEYTIPKKARELPKIPADHWAVWKGSMYVNLSGGLAPEDMNFAYAVRSVGVTLYEVHDLILRNLKVRHFRIDGFNAHDRCKNITLENITAEENGRAGVTVAGSSLIDLVKPTIKNNRRYSILITEKAGLQVDDETNITPAPTIAE